MTIDYSEHFWGDKHIGYNVLYENLKKGEDTVQEFSTFVKERISLEEDLHKSLSKSLIRINQYIANNGAFVEAWRMTKGTLELYCEIQGNMLKNLLDLSKDVIKYHDDLVKSRKRVKEQDVIDAVNLMQTTTTCLQKAKETYHHRCNEFLSMKNEAQTKEITRAKTKVIKAHEEYKMYVEKYGTVRENFQEKLMKAAKSFQAHDVGHLEQMKNFFLQFSKFIDESHASIFQLTTDYRNSLEKIDLDNIMLKFIEEKGTGKEKPEPIKWTENDELIDFDIICHSQSAPSSSNSSAIVAGIIPESTSQIVTNFIDLDSPTWTASSTRELNNKSPNGGGDSDVDNNQLQANNSQGYMSQFSSSIGRQKLAQWFPRRKKNCSQSSLPPNDEINNVGETKGGFLKRYRKSKNELSFPNENDDNKSVASSAKSGEDRMSNFGASGHGYMDSELTPTRTNAPMVDEDGFVIRQPDKKEDNPWNSGTSSSDEDENEFQTSKIKQLQIKPINESNTQLNTASVDELRNVIGHISLQRSTTFDKDPWSSHTGDFTQSLNVGGKPLRAVHTGDEHLRRKASADVDFLFGFTQSIGGSNSSNTIARARPRSNTPTALTASNFGLNSSLTGLSTITSESRTISTTSDLFNESIGSKNDDSSTLGTTPKYPIAMALNEFVHVWFKGMDGIIPEVKIFGTIVISFPSILIPYLTNITTELKSIKFYIENAEQVLNLIPNKTLILPTNINSGLNSIYSFTIDKLSLSNWLLEQVKTKPGLNFYNVDILRYELIPGFVPPLIMKSQWKNDNDETEIIIYYGLNDSKENTVDKALLNMVFTTKVNGNSEILMSEPESKLDKLTGILTWTITELTPCGEKHGTLKVRLKGTSKPTNTFVQFQVSEAIMSKLSLKIEPENGYSLSMTRKKLNSGKYFCEPSITGTLV